MGALLLQFVPLIPGLIKAGLVEFGVYNKVETVIAENRKPTESEWEQLDAMIAADKAAIMDTSRDV